MPQRIADGKRCARHRRGVSRIACGVRNQRVVEYFAIREHKRDDEGQHQDRRDAEPSAVGLGQPQREHRRRKMSRQQRQRGQPSPHPICRCPQERRGQRCDESTDQRIGSNERLALDGVPYQDRGHIRHEDIDAHECDVRVPSALESSPYPGARGHAAGDVRHGRKAVFNGGHLVPAALRHDQNFVPRVTPKVRGWLGKPL